MVYGLANKSTLKKLLNEKNLTLKWTLIEIVMMVEMAMLNPVEDTAVTDGNTDNGTDMLFVV